MNRDKDGVTHVVGLSGGKDSTALALRLRELHPDVPYNYVCTPTGNELPEMQAHWRRLETLLGQPLIMVPAPSLIDLIRQFEALPNFRQRWCTRIIKLQSYTRFLQAFLPVRSYIGLRADEEDREGFSERGADVLIKTKEERVEQVYPMQEWGWTVDDVWAFLAKRGVEIPARTDCAWCFFQRLGEWFLLWKNHREVWMEGERVETEIGHTFRTPGRDTWPVAMKDMRVRFETGDRPEVSLRMMEKRQNMCRRCTL